MWIKIILYHLIGYVRISVEGYYIERFINICMNNKITIWKMKREKNIRLTLNVATKDFKEIVKIAKKTQCKIKIENKKGIPFLLHKYKKRKMFAIFLLIIISLVIISSNFVWNIEIRQEGEFEVENIMQDLEQEGLVVGKLKAQIDTKEIINKIRLKRQDIAWIGIELKGTNAIVKVVKAEEKPEIIDEEEYCSIISDKAGIITKINAQNGTAAVKVGDTVNVGTVLIQGWMEGKYTGIRYVHSKGEIQAKVWYSKHKKILYNTTEEHYTGNKEKKYSIKFNNFKINFGKSLSNFKNYDTIEEEKKFRIFSDFYLPISIIKTTNKEQKQTQKILTVEEAKNLGIQELEQELEKEISQKENIVSKTINCYEETDGIDIYVTYEVLENIGTKEKIVF